MSYKIDRVVLQVDEDGNPSSSGGGGGPTTIVDGGHVSFGAKADTPATDDTGTWSLIALFKRLLQKLTAGITIAPATVAPTAAIKTVAAIATPEALIGVTTLVQSVMLIGIKAARTNNTGIVYLGIGGTNDAQFIPISPGERVEVSNDGNKFDLAGLFLDVLNAGDGVGMIYS